MPKIEIMPANNVTVTEGETVAFRCVVKVGNPPPTVVWEREANQPLNSSNDGVLVISPASADSKGKYICKATNVVGSTEAVALLIVQGKISQTKPVALGRNTGLFPVLQKFRAFRVMNRIEGKIFRVKLISEISVYLARLPSKLSKKSEQLEISVPFGHLYSGPVSPIYVDFVISLRAENL